MPRPSRPRRICKEPAYDRFLPEGIACGEQVALTLDEYEVLRLIDLDALTHEQCAQQMDISRTTVTEIYEAARRKVADSLVNGKPLMIAGGHYRLCDGSARRYCRKSCKRAEGAQALRACHQKGAHEMRIAVTYEDGEVFQHFGHTEQFKLYDTENGRVVNEQVVSTNGQGHGALAGFLSAAGVDAVICGGIGGGAQAALNEAGVALYGGVSGSADDAVRAYLAGNLAFDANARCDHHEHEHEHSCGEGHCGEHRQGCHGNESR
ncbi:MAG: DUF134 domain-containing protein [Clostridiales bacterium]|nr:DUF134 domain-containing protein [Clostridiales bacterium]